MTSSNISKHIVQILLNHLMLILAFTCCYNPGSIIVAVVTMFCDIPMGIFLNSELKSTVYGCIFKFIISMILSPFAPLIIFYLRKYHYHQALEDKLRNCFLGLIHKNPEWEKEFEGEDNMNFYRWIRIQKYRHKPFKNHTI